MKSYNQKRANLNDVALAAGTSVATVSRVLNNTGYSSEDIKTRVKIAAENLHYQPNLHAKSLRQKKSNSIGLLIPNLLNAYYTALADDVSQLLNVHGYQLLLSSTRDDEEIEKNTLRQLIGHNVDGLIWVPTASDSELTDLVINKHIPAVSIVRKVKGNRLPTLVFEDFAGAYAATNHLLKLGHTRIGLIGGNIAHSSNNDRLQGYIKALKDASVFVDQSLIKMGSLNDDRGSASAESFLQLIKPPTAIFVASNALMAGVMKTITHHDVHIPDEISLICFDDLEWFQFSKPPISAIAINHARLAEAAVELLLKHIKNPAELDKPAVFMQISYELVLRASTASPYQM
ncbi:MAG: LacI family DNA-binding transcriptional regulator [Chloroflexi bacterium]|nr:LacI family DNA-binding transcriptional regulator [Chloroflexota bacterium]